MRACCSTGDVPADSRASSVRTPMAFCLPSSMSGERQGLLRPSVRSTFVCPAEVVPRLCVPGAGVSRERVVVRPTRAKRQGTECPSCRTLTANVAVSGRISSSPRGRSAADELVLSGLRRDVAVLRSGLAQHRPTQGASSTGPHPTPGRVACCRLWPGQWKAHLSVSRETDEPRSAVSVPRSAASCFT